MWHELAHCGPATAHLFHSDELEQQERALRICGHCPVRIECLHHSITNNELEGIWGGVSEDLRRWLRAQYRAGPNTYKAAVVDVLAPQRPWQPARACDRCSADVPAGRHPIDQNGPRSTCELVSTYNKGCRCTACSDAKADYSRARKTAAKAAAKLDSSSPKPTG